MGLSRRLGLTGPGQPDGGAVGDARRQPHGDAVRARWHDDAAYESLENGLRTPSTVAPSGSHANGAELIFQARPTPQNPTIDSTENTSTSAARKCMVEPARPTDNRRQYGLAR